MSFLSPVVYDRLRFAAALLYVLVVMLLPHRADWVNAQSFVFVPLELWLFGLLLLLPVGSWLRTLLGIVLGVGLIVRLADLAAFAVFARSFDPVLDAHLLNDGVHLLAGAVGTILAWLIALLLILVVIAGLVLSVRALGVLQRELRRNPRRAAACLVLGLALTCAWRFAGMPRTTTYFSDQLREHAVATYNSWQDLKQFRAELALEAAVELADIPLFERLRGKDVVVVFVESYGRTALEHPLFAPTLNSVLERAETSLDEAGFATRSAWLRSPTVGGLSWLAHATALSGLWIDSQLRHDSLLRSERPTLNRLFQQAGWRTVGVMPAITMPWPEGSYYGYDQFYAAADLGYRGAPFNWVTMPDQYVLSAFQQLERKTHPRTPVMAEIALISSHAPWTPIPHAVPWEDVTDGSIFTLQANSGPTPEEVWSDDSRIRDHYRQAVAYSLETLTSWIATQGDDDLVVIVLGDHQPAPLVSGDPDNRDVPVHLIARDPAVLDAIVDWEWQPGLRPDAEAPEWRMDSLRGHIIEAFTTPTLIETAALP